MNANKQISILNPETFFDYIILYCIILPFFDNQQLLLVPVCNNLAG